MSGSRRVARVAALVLAATVAACAPRSTSVALPTGPGAPLAAEEARALAAAVRTPCAAAGALTADLRVAGRVDGERIRGTLQLGVDDTAVRIEGVPPFGAPLFLLAGKAEAATLLFVRENAYVPDTPVEALIEALVGLPLTPADLHGLVAGCGVAPGAVAGGAAYGDTWRRVDGAGGTRLWMTRGADGVPVLRVAETTGWRLDYADRAAGTAVRGTLAARGANPRTRLTFEVVDPERLPTLPPAALELVIPEQARPVSLDELRRRRVLAAS